MEFPIEIQMLINDYARPLTRPDWRKGSIIMTTTRMRFGGVIRLGGRLNIMAITSETIFKSNIDIKHESIMTNLNLIILK